MNQNNLSKVTKMVFSKNWPKDPRVDPHLKSVRNISRSFFSRRNLFSRNHQRHRKIFWAKKCFWKKKFVKKKSALFFVGSWQTKIGLKRNLFFELWAPISNITRPLSLSWISEITFKPKKLFVIYELFLNIGLVIK